MRKIAIFWYYSVLLEQHFSILMGLLFINQYQCNFGHMGSQEQIVIKALIFSPSTDSGLSKEAELAQLDKGVDVYPDHPGSSPHRGEFGCLFSS
jgi:hypothetical protein